MTLVDLEGSWVNTEQVCVVRAMGHEETKFMTEVVLAAGSVKVTMAVADVVNALRKAAGQAASWP
jgi:hypothetical protein